MKEWVLTREAFDRLLAQLDPDRERAGEKYEEIRRKLMKFFQWRGCARPEEYTDRTIDRVMRRITEGVELRVKDPYLYFHGVALNVLREHWKEPEREQASLEEIQPSHSPAHHPIELAEQELERLEKEKWLECLNQCLQHLPPESLSLITEYHQSEKRGKIEGRKTLAERLKIPLNALRIRAYRIRGELEKCVNKCAKRAPG
jgi:DNA-directed RNA polymerase specialized sigma24 family protein